MRDTWKQDSNKERDSDVISVVDAPLDSRSTTREWMMAADINWRKYKPTRPEQISCKRLFSISTLDFLQHVRVRDRDLRKRASMCDVVKMFLWHLPFCDLQSEKCLSFVQTKNRGKKAIYKRKERENGH